MLEALKEKQRQMKISLNLQQTNLDDLKKEVKETKELKEIELKLTSEAESKRKRAEGKFRGSIKIEQERLDEAESKLIITTERLEKAKKSLSIIENEVRKSEEGKDKVLLQIKEELDTAKNNTKKAIKVAEQAGNKAKNAREEAVSIIKENKKFIKDIKEEQGREEIKVEFLKNESDSFKSENSKLGKEKDKLNIRIKQRKDEVKIFEKDSEESKIKLEEVTKETKNAEHKLKEALGGVGNIFDREKKLTQTTTKVKKLCKELGIKYNL